MHSNLIELYKKRLKLSKVQREIIIGLLLGDGHLETQNNGRTYRIKIEHSIKQKVYVDWLYSQFREWVIIPPQIKVTTLNGTEFKKYWFNTISHGNLRFYAHQFYDKFHKKLISRFIKKWLTPLALAIWFMDDGSIKSHQTKSLILNTHCFVKKDLWRLQNAMKLKFNIILTLRKQREGYQLFIPSEEADKFVNLINFYVLPEMKYKYGKARLTYLPKE